LAQLAVDRCQRQMGAQNVGIAADITLQGRNRPSGRPPWQSGADAV
jgi:hypothetical protein